MPNGEAIRRTGTREGVGPEAVFKKRIDYLGDGFATRWGELRYTTEYWPVDLTEVKKMAGGVRVVLLVRAVVLAELIRAGLGNVDWDCGCGVWAEAQCRGYSSDHWWKEGEDGRRVSAHLNESGKVTEVEEFVTRRIPGRYKDLAMTCFAQMLDEGLDPYFGDPPTY